MAWRLGAAEFERGKGPSNRRRLQRLARAGPPPGILAYERGEPVGWCAVAPRDVYVRLDRSRVLRPVDDTPVWSISCLFVEKARRARGVSVALLDAAARFAGKQGARVVEGYPVVPYTDRMPAAFAWTGTLSAFLAAGFTEVARRSRTRPIVRRSVSA
jgi:GNAT superfamily N-acetyltransferase